MKTGPKSYKILWGSIPVILILTLFGKEGAFDLQLHDTYLVTSTWHVAILFAFLLSLLGVIYWLLRNYKLVPGLSKIHVITTLISLIGIILISIQQTVSRAEDFELFRRINSIGIILILALIFAQLLFMTNIIVGLIRGKKEKAG